MEKEIIRENIEKLKIDVENEQKKEIEKREMFVEDLDAQIVEKDKLVEKGKQEPKDHERLRVEMIWDQRTRDKNELAKQLSKWSFEPTDASVITVIKQYLICLLLGFPSENYIKFIG